MFLLYIKRNIFFIQCLYGYVIVTFKPSYKDVPGSMNRGQTRADINAKKKKMRIAKCEKNANRRASTDTSLTSSQVIFFSNGFHTFSFFMRAFIKNAEND